MEKFQILREEAKKNIQLADHMLTVTYPLVKDPKLLLAVVENIFLSLTNSMGSVLYHERLFKNIPPFNDNFESKFNMFHEKIIPRHNIDKDYERFIQEVKDIITAHKKSPVEFSRKDSFVICSDEYKMKTISINELKEYISKARSFIQETNTIVSKHEGIFRKS